jgi:serine/threonine protein kinase
MGIVYLGKDPKINRQVAIKTLKFDDEMDAAATKEIKERFFREAESAGTLNHPNIIRVFDAGDDSEISFIAMEYLEGEDLKKFTDKNNLLPPVVSMDYAAKVADALDYAHAHGVVHRDVKPANVMRLKDGSLRVTDFGIARITASSKTTTGTVMGTPSYMAPEQIAGRKVDGRADLFSLGVMMYELLAGVKPFEGDSIATLLFKISNEPHPDPVPLAGGRVSPAAKAVIDRALQKDPEKRYQKGADMARDIREAMRNPAGAPKAPPPATLTEKTMPFIPPAPPKAPSLSGEATFKISEPPPRPASPPAPFVIEPAPAAPPRLPPGGAPARPAAAPTGGEQTVKIPAGPPPAPAAPPAPPAAPKPPERLPPVLPAMSDFGLDVAPGVAPPPPSPVPGTPSGATAPAAPAPEPVFEIVKDIPPPKAFQGPPVPPEGPRP